MTPGDLYSEAPSQQPNQLDFLLAHQYKLFLISHKLYLTKNDLSLSSCSVSEGSKDMQISESWGSCRHLQTLWPQAPHNSQRTLDGRRVFSDFYCIMECAKTSVSLSILGGKLCGEGSKYVNCCITREGMWVLMVKGNKEDVIGSGLGQAYVLSRRAGLKPGLHLKLRST